jgi:hypothetical protein
VFYEIDSLLLRASYNRRGELVQGLVNGLNVFEEPYYQIDVNAAYNITPALSLTASVLNLTKQESRSHLGEDSRARFYTGGYAGRLAYLGADLQVLAPTCRAHACRMAVWARWFGDGRFVVEVNLEPLFRVTSKV